jgi:hypothetical protein
MEPKRLTKKRVKLKYVTHLLLLVIFISSCSTTRINLVDDNKWHNVYALQTDTLAVLKVKVKYKKYKTLKGENPRTDLRLVRLTPFMNYDSLPETPPVIITTETRTEDFGPQDILQNGSVRIVTLGAGSQILSRTNQPNTIFIIKQLKTKQNGNNK